MSFGKIRTPGSLVIFETLNMCNNSFPSALQVEAKPSEVLQGTNATISCVVSGLARDLDDVKWVKPENGSTSVITDMSEGYTVDEGSFNSSSKTQTTVLTVDGSVNTADVNYTCVIEYENTTKKANVSLEIFSE